MTPQDPWGLNTLNTLVFSPTKPKRRLTVKEFELGQYVKTPDGVGVIQGIDQEGNYWVKSTRHDTLAAFGYYELASIHIDEGGKEINKPEEVAIACCRYCDLPAVFFDVFDAYSNDNVPLCGGCYPMVDQWNGRKRLIASGIEDRRVREALRVIGTARDERVQGAVRKRVMKIALWTAFGTASVAGLSALAWLVHGWVF